MYFGLGYSVYCFETYCTRNKGLKLTTVFVNSDSECSDLSLKAFLLYLKQHTATDDFTREVDMAILQLKKDEELRSGYTTIEEQMKEDLHEAREEARNEALKEGMEEGQ